MRTFTKCSTTFVREPCALMHQHLINVRVDVTVVEGGTLMDELESLHIVFTRCSTYVEVTGTEGAYGCSLVIASQGPGGFLGRTAPDASAVLPTEPAGMSQPHT